MKKILNIWFILLISGVFVISCSGNGFLGGNKAISNPSNNDDLEQDDDDDDGFNEENNQYDPDGDGTITEEEYDSTKKNLYGPMSASVHRIESDCTACKAVVTLKLYKIGDKKVSSSVKTKSAVTITFSSKGASVTGSSEVCPTKNVVARYEMSISFNGSTVEASDQSILLGARDPSSKHKMYIGLADTAAPYEFHNMDSVIGSMLCPDAKRIVIKNLCRDQVLEGDKTLLRCWMTQGRDSSCPSENVYSSGSYPAQCKTEK